MSHRQPDWMRNIDQWNDARGHRSDWQGQWLRARTTAELARYLPMLAPLLDWHREPDEANWYLRVFDPGNHVRAADEIGALCVRSESIARGLLATAWPQPAFVENYALWATGILAHQRHYHLRLASKQHALLHRVHALNTIALILEEHQDWNQVVRPHRLPLA